MQNSTAKAAGLALFMFAILCAVGAGIVVKQGDEYGPALFLSLLSIIFAIRSIYTPPSDTGGSK